MNLNIFRKFKKDLSKDDGIYESTTGDDYNLLSSHVVDKDGVAYHMPLLDLDVEHLYVQSSTPGHAHLYINVLLSESEYDELLTVLNKCGIIQDGIINHQWKPQGATFLRPPDVKKMAGEIASGSVVNGFKELIIDPPLEIHELESNEDFWNNYVKTEVAKIELTSTEVDNAIAELNVKVKKVEQEMQKLIQAIGG